jgi:transcriptional regulator with XRE-family HTH domain
MKNTKALKAHKTKSKALGDTIRALRRQAGLSQMRLASLSHLELSTVHRIESAKTDTNLSTLCRIKEALGASWSDLLRKI